MNNSNVRPADDELLVRDQICKRLKISRRKLWELERADKAPLKWVQAANVISRPCHRRKIPSSTVKL